jgi:hypothetical protein
LPSRDKETKKAILAITEEFEKEIEDGLIDQVKAESDLVCGSHHR